MSTLSVQEAMGFKVDREAVATLVLPQLWAMSMGPCKPSISTLLFHYLIIYAVLSVGQFQRFMEVIRKLGQRVEKEHDQFLRDSQRLEDHSTVAMDGGPGINGNAVSVDFESLVGKANGGIVKADTVTDVSWDNDVWGSIFNSSAVSFAFIDLVMGVVDIITTAFHNSTFGIARHTNSTYVICTWTINFPYCLISTDKPSTIKQTWCDTSVYGQHKSSQVAKSGFDSIRSI